MALVQNGKGELHGKVACDPRAERGKEGALQVVFQKVLPVLKS